MPILKPEFQKTLSENPRLWASRFGVPLAQVEDWLMDKGKIHPKTAEKIRKKYADLFTLDCKASDLFDESRFVGADPRKVRHVFAETPMRDDDKLKVFRFLFEKRMIPGEAAAAISVLILVFDEEFKSGVYAAFGWLNGIFESVWNLFS